MLTNKHSQNENAENCSGNFTEIEWFPFDQKCCGRKM